jgi:excinuclease ABC subunit A
MDLISLEEWIGGINNILDQRRQLIAYEIVREIQNRIHFLLDVGIGYLTLNRPARSLSGGESQRIRLATQIGSQLVGVLYILDEPSIGLHQHDNLKLIKALQSLRDTGNSVIVVEHDKETILAADYVIDIGPGAGVHGGRIVAHGTPEEIKRDDHLTGQYLSGKEEIKVPRHRREGNGKQMILYGADGNNLKKINLKLPLGKLICITGLSGSGKSSLINETLYPVLSRHFYKSDIKPLGYDRIEGIKNIDKVIEIDQSPIGRTPRSNPATYTKVFDEIRKLYASLPESKIRGYMPGRFSFNVKGGRCETCKGAGLRVIEMNFLPDVYVLCETCQGHRYNRETLEVRYKGKSINDVLNMTIEQAVDFFASIPMILNKINTLNEVGLGYITLGQQSTTLSGGEAQRVKLASELSKSDTGNTLYILDEPTTGLHFEDVKVLLCVLNKLVAKGNTVLVIEHNMEVIKVADHIIDLGPEGGERGGNIVCEGTPEEVAGVANSYTGVYLRKELISK